MMRALIVLIAVFLASMAQAQDRRPSHCIALVQDTPGLEVIWKAGFRDPLPDAYTVRLSYIDHSMYLLQTQGGLSVVTDYNGFIGPDLMVPDVVTMNHAHSSHWTSAPDPAIPHVLRGWAGPEGAADHHLDLGEMLVRNVPTDIRSGFGGSEPNGNSIFIFEVAGLCIGHLGHLHHQPSAEQYAAIGRLDVVMAPIDGGMTLPLTTMIDVLTRFRASIVLPMHYFSGASLNAFLAGMQSDFRVEVRPARSLEVSLRSLPSEPTIVVLQPRMLGFNDDEF